MLATSFAKRVHHNLHALQASGGPRPTKIKVNPVTLKFLLMETFGMPEEKAAEAAKTSVIQFIGMTVIPSDEVPTDGCLIVP